ncbi:glycosyltransferase [Aeromonas enteropelogenes]|uniref:glycosyltransferase family protein n=1 Tax=Aeromonas enteropelogenes TaxID=29489 RepID=UPI0005AA0CC4|nr:glycosyltransferase [Aeromonas enteropelogenes]UBH57737.1 glycosyltransferase [Aeromonas enteropelogenes]
MAKVLLCFSSHLFVDGGFKLISYYEGLIKELKKCGNQVMVVNCAEFLNKSWNSDNEENRFLKTEQLKADVSAFNPDLVISFNNTKLSFIEELFDCPIVIWEADSFTFYNDKEKIKANPDRYHFFCLSNDARKQIKSIGACEDRIHMINSGTAVEAQSLEKIHNVSFIGSNFKGPKGLRDLLQMHNTPDVKQAVRYLSENFYVDPEEYLTKNNLSVILEYLDPLDFGMISSAQNRVNTLNAMAEFGLTLFGSSSWLDTVETCPNLAMAFQPESVYSLRHNQDIYNTSQICLNVSHAQAVDGFSWRIMDIMASNGCLLSSYNKGIERFTKGYIDIPMFRSSGEASGLARKLLNDASYRDAVVEGSQACIQDRGRWEHRFQEIYDALGICLVNAGENGSAVSLKRDNYLKDNYIIYAKSVYFVASLMSNSSRNKLYFLAKNLGFNIDYHMIKSVMEKK